MGTNRYNLKNMIFPDVCEQQVLQDSNKLSAASLLMKPNSFMTSNLVL